MGDQVGVAVSGTLLYVPYKEFERIRLLSISPVEKTALFAVFCRINTLYMIACAGSGHIGSSFSSIDIMSWLLLNELQTHQEGDPEAPNNIFFSSKGHDAPALYSAWIGLGKLNFDLIHRLRRLNGLPGHPDVSIPNIVANTGSLGMGISKAKGMIFANKLKKRIGNVYVLTGDGELQEGQFWESLISAANNRTHELTVIIDHNKLQSDTLVSKVSDLGDLEAKLASFGWHVSRCNGNDLWEFSRTLAATKLITNMPKVIIADTVKGKGVSFMEHTSIDSDVEFYKFHSGAPSDDAYVRAAQELIDFANAKLAAINVADLELLSVTRPVTAQPQKQQRLIQAYSSALLNQAQKNPRIITLDADLMVDTGLLSFQKEFPDRFIECGIAEQDMVSQAGGIALQGLLPIVHSFSCFLSSRPNEQIYNNATEQKKIIYVGSLAGLIPAGPGHSHQAVRDIAAIGGIPSLTIMEPSCEEEVKLLLDWAVEENDCSSYLRLVSASCEVPYTLPVEYKIKKGCGITISNGPDMAIIAYGPLLLSEAYLAIKEIKEIYGVNIKLINLPWLNYIDSQWLRRELTDYKFLISIDNHSYAGGQGDLIASELIKEKSISSIDYTRMGLRWFPECGSSDEVLKHHGLDKTSILELVRKKLNLNNE